jgi:hypothetical protein
MLRTRGGANAIRAARKGCYGAVLGPPPLVPLLVCIVVCGVVCRVRVESVLKR